MSQALQRDLQRLLASHATLDAEEYAQLLDMRTLAHSQEAIFDRRHVTPGHFTASGFVVSPDGLSLLLVRHDKLQRWLQPGGHIDPDDASIEAAARREIAEEAYEGALVAIGILDIDVHPIPAFGSEAAHRHFDVRFAFQARQWELAAGAGTSKARWVAATEVTLLAPERSILRPLDKVMERIRLARCETLP